LKSLIGSLISTEQLQTHFFTESQTSQKRSTVGQVRLKSVFESESATGALNLQDWILTDLDFDGPNL